MKGNKLNIARIYDQKYNVIQDKMYNKVDVSNTVGKDEPTDECGFLGIGEHYRDKRALKNISEDEFYTVMYSNMSKMREIMLNIKEIDKDHNGYVTRTELDDIIKINVPDLADRILFPIINQWCSIQNKILIDYKQFRDAVMG